MKIILPKSAPKFLPVNKANQRFKSKKDYSRKAKHKKKLDSES